MEKGHVCGLLQLDFQIITGAEDGGLTLTLPWGNEMDTTKKEIRFLTSSETPQGPPLDFYVYESCENVEPSQRLHDALKFATDVYTEPKQFEWDDYGIGFNGYKNWCKALEEETFNTHGHWWNAMVWGECRFCVSEYLGQIETGDDALTQALRHLGEQYATIAQLIFDSGDNEMATSDKLENIKQAYQAEEKAAEQLKDLVNEAVS